MYSLPTLGQGVSYLLVNAQVPISSFWTGAPGEMSKSKMSMGRPSVMHALGIYRLCVSLGLQGYVYRETYVDQPGNMPLDGSTAEEEVDLVVAVACRDGSAYACYSYRCCLEGGSMGMKGGKKER